MGYLGLDMETDGLDPHGQILEIAWQYADNLAGLAPEREIHSRLVELSPLRLKLIEEKANEYVQKLHTDNGLWQDLKRGTVRRLEHIDSEIAFWLAHRPGPHYLVGNSIRLDRAFIEANMPLTAEALHYRQIDLTTFELMAVAKGLESTQVEVEGTAHRAEDDLRTSLRQLEKQLAVLDKAGRYGGLEF